MILNKTIQEINSLRDAAIEDLLSLSDEELRSEAKQDGEDMDAVATHTKRLLRETAATTLRMRMTMGKAKPLLSAVPLHSMIRPSIERMKQLVENVFATNLSAGLAFREGKRQSEADWQSLYDDYVALGAINPEDDES